MRLRPVHLLSLLRLWVVVCTIGDALLFSHCIQVFVVHGDVPPHRQVLTLGLASACLLLSLLRYLDFSPGLYSTMLTINNSGPSICRFLVGVAPVFVAFCLFALVAFGRYIPRYGSSTLAFMTLFAFYNGDALRETFTHTEATGSAYRTVLGDIHLCLLILLFTYVVTNCTVALVEQAFFDTRTAHAHDMVRKARLRKIHIRMTMAELLMDRPVTATGTGSGSLHSLSGWGLRVDSAGAGGGDKGEDAAAMRQGLLASAQ